MSDQAGLRADLDAAAAEELVRACTLDWPRLAPQTPWGDAYEGFTPLGRTVTFERNYLWEGEEGGDIRVEVTVFEAKAFEDGAHASRIIPKPQIPTSEAGADE